MPLTNYMFTVAFTVISPNDAENITEAEILDGIERRLKDLRRTGEAVEAVGLPEDSYVVAEDIEPDMVTVSVSDATEEQIDWLTAKSLGHEVVFFDDFYRTQSRLSGRSEFDIDMGLSLHDLRGQFAIAVPPTGSPQAPGCANERYAVALPRYSSDAAASWAIFEEERIELRDRRPFHDDWEATIKVFRLNNFGPTRLIAGLRCFIGSKMGEQVQVPAALAPVQGEAASPKVDRPRQRG